MLKKERLDFGHIEALEKAKVLREEADYYGEFTEGNAKELLNKTEEFLDKAKEILAI